jgi:hypothetical protein
MLALLPPSKENENHMLEHYGICSIYLQSIKVRLKGIVVEIFCYIIL